MPENNRRRKMIRHNRITKEHLYNNINNGNKEFIKMSKNEDGEEEGESTEDEEERPMYGRRCSSLLCLVKLAVLAWRSTPFTGKLKLLIYVAIEATMKLVYFLKPIFYKKLIDGLNNLGKGEAESSDIKLYITVYSCLYFTLCGSYNGLLPLCKMATLLEMFQSTKTEAINIAFEKVIHQSVEWHEHVKTGALLSRLTRGREGMQKVMDSVIRDIIPLAINVVITTVYLSTQFKLGLGVFLLSSALTYVIVTIGTMKLQSRAQQQLNKAEDNILVRLTESLESYNVVKHYTGEETERGLLKRLLKCLMKKARTHKLTLQLVKLLHSSILAATIFIGSWMCYKMVANDSMTAGDYVLFMTFFEQLFTPLNLVSNNLKDINAGLNNVKDLMQLMEMKHDPLECMAGSDNCLGLQGSLSLLGVGVKVPQSSSWILKDISFKVPKGLKICLVGASGQGKSTLLNLCGRVTAPTRGAIMLDDKPLQRYDLRTLRQRGISLMPAQTPLFDGTVSFNLLYGNDADIDSETMMEVCKKLGIHKEIAQLPEGYETEVGRWGRRLSTGQRQRVLLARTLLRRADLVLLDEPTSALDANSINKMWKTIEDWDKTVVIATHCLTLMECADWIVMIKDGGIVEEGTYKELIGKMGAFYELVQQQKTKKCVDPGYDSDSEVVHREEIEGESNNIFPATRFNQRVQPRANGLVAKERL